jgi:hypothetical protein
MGLFHKQEEPSADDTEVLEEETVKEPGAKYIILPLLFEMLLLGILFLKNRTASLNYLYALIPLLLLTAGIGTYVYNREGNMKLFMSAACLSALGIALQMLIDQVYHPITVFSFWKLMLGIAGRSCLYSDLQLFPQISEFSHYHVCHDGRFCCDLSDPDHCRHRPQRLRYKRMDPSWILYHTADGLHKDLRGHVLCLSVLTACPSR